MKSICQEVAIKFTEPWRHNESLTLCLQLLIVRHFVEGALLFKLKLFKKKSLVICLPQACQDQAVCIKRLEGNIVIACLLHENCICSKAEGHGRLDLYLVRFLHTRCLKLQYEAWTAIARVFRKGSPNKSPKFSFLPEVISQIKSLSSCCT